MAKRARAFSMLVLMPRRQGQVRGTRREEIMPEVMMDGKVKHFPYTKRGRKAAKRARNRNYSAEALKMARSIHG